MKTAASAERSQGHAVDQAPYDRQSRVARLFSVGQRRGQALDLAAIFGGDAGMQVDDALCQFVDPPEPLGKLVALRFGGAERRGDLLDPGETRIRDRRDQALHLGRGVGVAAHQADTVAPGGRRSTGEVVMKFANESGDEIGIEHLLLQPIEYARFEPVGLDPALAAAAGACGRAAAAPLVAPAHDHAPAAGAAEDQPRKEVLRPAGALWPSVRKILAARLHAFP